MVEVDCGRGRHRVIGTDTGLIGTDTGLLEAPDQRDRLQLSPGERAELVVEVVPDERAILRSFLPDLGMTFPVGRSNGGHDEFDIIQLRGASQLDESPPLPTELLSLDLPAEAEASRT